MEMPSAKRRKSDEGLLGLLGAYGSEEEEEEENVNEGDDSSEAVIQAINMISQNTCKTSICKIRSGEPNSIFVMHAQGI